MTLIVSLEEHTQITAGNELPLNRGPDQNKIKSRNVPILFLENEDPQL